MNAKSVGLKMTGKGWMAMLWMLVLGIFVASQAYAADPAKDTERVKRVYKFKFRGKSEVIKLNFSKALVDYYEAKTHYWPRSYQDYRFYATEDVGFRYISSLANALKTQSESSGYTDAEMVDYIVAFVQSLQYYPENEEYIRYPIETLAHGGGDCEDTSILLSSILNALGYDAVLLGMPSHMAVGLAGNSYSGAGVIQNGVKYFFTETTSSGFKVGEIKKSIADQRMEVLRLDAQPGTEDTFARLPVRKPTVMLAGDVQY